MLLLGILNLSASVAQESLSQELEHLSQAILAKAETPLIQLEHLKLLFLHCGERQEKVALASACQSWLKDSYPKMREALLLKSSRDLQTEGKVLGAKEASPQRIWVALGTGEISVTQIGEKRHYDGEGIHGSVYSTGDWYEVRIPKY